MGLASRPLNHRGKSWYADPITIRISFTPVILLKFSFNCAKRAKPTKKIYRNLVLYAHELNDEIRRDNLTRKQLAERYGISSERDLVRTLPENLRL